MRGWGLRRGNGWDRRLTLALCLGALGCSDGQLVTGSLVRSDGFTPDGAPSDADARLDPDAGDRDAAFADDGPPDLGGDGAPERDAVATRDAGADGEPERDALVEDAGPPPDGSVREDARLPPSDASSEDAAVEPPDAAVEPPDAAVEPPDAAPLPPCPTYDPAAEVGLLADPAIREASGLSASRRTAGVLWTHNDSGDGSRVFALSDTGEQLGVVELGGPRPRDWEDLAVGPGPEPGVSYLYLGDIGDNGRARDNLRIRRFAEPEVVRAAEPFSIRLEDAEDLTLVYPDGPHDAESIMVDPRTSDVFLVVKSGDGISPVFRAAAPLSAEGAIALEQVARLEFNQGLLRGGATTTGSDISAAGDAIIIRTYGSAYLWRRAPGASIGAALRTQPCPLPLARERQGESIGFAADGRGYFTVSEGLNAPIFFYARR